MGARNRLTIHLTSHFTEEIGAGKSVEEALMVTVTGTGKGVVTGALTTAAAFFVLMMAEAPVIFQFGFCAGSGVVMTLGAAMFILPSILVSRYEKRKDERGSSASPKEVPFLCALSGFTHAHHRIVLITALALFVLGAMSFPHVP